MLALTPSYFSGQCECTLTFPIAREVVMSFTAMFLGFLISSVVSVKTGLRLFCAGNLPNPLKRRMEQKSRIEGISVQSLTGAGALPFYLRILL